MCRVASERERRAGGGDGGGGDGGGGDGGGGDGGGPGVGGADGGGGLVRDPQHMLSDTKPLEEEHALFAIV